VTKRKDFPNKDEDGVCMQQSGRIEQLPPYLFAEIDRKIEAKRKAGIDVISLGIGDPVEPTPHHIIEKLCEAVRNPENHRYPSYSGLPAFREAIALWYKTRFGVTLDPDKEILPLIGSKEGIAHISVALLESGSYSLVPDPAYPVYGTGAILADGIPYPMPLLADNDFLPDLEIIDRSIAKKSRIMFLNYPNNPTGAVADEGFLEDCIEFAQSNEITICYDNPYSELTFDGYIAPSFLQIPGAKETGVEFHSLSKTYNMTGWRIGWVAGDSGVIKALGNVKENIDSGIFNAIQYAGIGALTGPQDCIREMCKIYERRRDLVIAGLADIGIEAIRPKATIYVWAPVPSGKSSADFATDILEKAAVVVSPGNAYGPSGEGYIRMCLSVKDHRLEEALERIKNVL
jgi:LL-diaminopimelate aminotransferase